VVVALALGRRELRRSGTYPPRRFDELVDALAARNGQERTPLGDPAQLPEPECVDYREGARRLGVSERTMRRLVAAGELPAVRAGRRVLLRTADLREFGVRCRVG
jgi:excisionase family DNA binding protein